MGSNVLIDIYGLFYSAEMEMACCHSKIPEIDSALLETIEHLQAAQASLKTVLTFRPETETETKEEEEKEKEKEE